MNRFTKLAKDAIAKNGHRCFATQTAVQVPKTTQDFAKMLKTAAIEGVKTSANLESGRKQPVRVAVTGAAGQIGYSLLPRIANGEMLGKDQPVILHLLERPEALKALDGVVMELQDCAFPLLHGVVPTSDMAEGFSQVDYALLVGAKPRGPGMERADVLKDNAKIFQIQGKALSDNAKSDCLVLVVGNPANTNAYILSKNAPKLDPKNITAMTRLDQDRALAQLAIKANCNVDDIDRISIWGNHSATQYPDLFHTTIKGDWARSKINNDEKWIREHFIPTVQKRGAAIIAARGLSSAASAADAAIKHMHDWVLGSGKWVSMAIRSDGSYGVPEGIWSSFPVKCSGGGDYVVVDGLPIDEFAAEKINASITELIDEQKTVDSLLK